MSLLPSNSNSNSKSTVVVYDGDTRLGELLPIPTPNHNHNHDSSFVGPEIRIHHLSPLSERCHPLSVLHTLSPYSLRCKLQPHPHHHDDTANQLLLNLHASCFYDRKTAVVLLQSEELHLVAMPSKSKIFPCFWCYSLPRNPLSPALYSHSLALLNLRCLSIVFDLDETLIVANTMKSFEDRIEALKTWIAREGDPLRASGMSAELKRYADDRALLKQYTENDSVVSDGGKLYKVFFEEVLPISDNQETFSRPVIRLPDKNLVLTRINPENRDTSVLVRLRPAWEDLRSYLTAKGRKRFEVFVCTMAERDYALEMWRLLDPEANLINSKQLMNRVVCVKSGSRKSLLNVFQDGICHPNMAMVIDDRLKVWEDKDQPRVHVVPAFTPYYAPQAETANAVPVLCVARNVACNVRGGFFKEFDEILLRKISELFYEDEMSNLPSPPDVSNYLITEETGFVPNGNTNIPFSEGISGAEVEQGLSQFEEKSAVDQDNHSGTNILDSGSENSQLLVPSAADAANTLRTVIPPQKSLLGVPAKKDAKNSLCDPPILRLPVQTSQGSWSVGEDSSRGYMTNRGNSPLYESDAIKSRAFQSSVGSSAVPSVPPLQISKGRSEETTPGQEVQKNNFSQSNSVGIGSADAAESKNLAPTHNKEAHTDPIKVNSLPSSLSISVLQEIGRRCFSKVEFKPVLSTSKDLQFSVEVLFTGEKIGVGMGKTRKDAQQQAAENALRCLADKYLACVTHSGIMERDDRVSSENENGFIWDDLDAQLDEQPSDEKHRETGLEAVELAPGSTSSMVTNQRDVISSPLPLVDPTSYPLIDRKIRPQQSSSIKQSREEMLRGSQSSSFRQRNGHPFS